MHWTQCTQPSIVQCLTLQVTLSIKRPGSDATGNPNLGCGSTVAPEGCPWLQSLGTCKMCPDRGEMHTGPRLRGPLRFWVDYMHTMLLAMVPPFLSLESLVPGAGHIVATCKAREGGQDQQPLTPPLADNRNREAPRPLTSPVTGTDGC